MLSQFERTAPSPQNVLWTKTRFMKVPKQKQKYTQAEVFEVPTICLQNKYNIHCIDRRKIPQCKKGPMKMLQYGGLINVPEHSFIFRSKLTFIIHLHPLPWIWRQLNFSEKVASKEMEKFKIACARIQIISNSPSSVHELLVLQYKRLKKMDYLSNSSEWAQLWTEAFAVSSYLKRLLFQQN